MDTTQIGPQGVAAAAGRSWRRHSAEFKARVIELARQPGTSVAAVALANGLNANMLRRWIHEAAAICGASKSDTTCAAPAPTGFVQLPMRQPEPHAVLDAQPRPALTPPPADITVEIHRGGTTVHAKLPMDDRSGAWLREVLG
jgi:transposase